jgi:2-desacetyl-2-hydroxyethyl bacteriochlorophyllide A dehydrogenase
MTSTPSTQGNIDMTNLTATPSQRDTASVAERQGTTMNAVVYTHYGSPDVLQLKEVAKPTPKDDEVLIKIRAASVGAGSWHLLRGKPFLVRLSSGLSRPKHPILGADIAGRVEQVGKNVTQFKIGDEVFGDLSKCGFGGFAEYVNAPENALVLKPTNLTFEQAAAVPVAAVTALQGLRDKGNIQAGQKVLINGASGGVGMFAVQLAKAFGAEVTAVCSTKNVDMVRTLGADHVIDYSKEDFTKNGQQYDLILAANGNRSIFEYRRALAPRGRYVMSGGSNSQFLQATLLGPLLSMTGSKKMLSLLAKPNQKDLAFIKELLEAGKLTPVLDRDYQLSQVPEAIRYLEEKHPKGKVIIKIGSEHVSTPRT